MTVPEHLRNRVRSQASRIFKHPTKRGIAVIPGHPNTDQQPGTERSVRKQAGMPRKEPKL